jgi:hypothetical protein
LFVTIARKAGHKVDECLHLKKKLEREAENQAVGDKNMKSMTFPWFLLMHQHQALKLRIVRLHLLINLPAKHGSVISVQRCT